MNEVFYLEKNVSYNYLFEIFMKEVGKNFYKSKETPLFSLKYVEFIHPQALTKLIMIGIALKAFYRKSIPLELGNNIYLNKYLFSVGFFNITGKNYLNIFEIQNEDFLWSSLEKNIKKYRENHKLMLYFPKNEFYDIKKEDERIKYRTKLYEEIRLYLVPKQYKNLLLDTEYIKEGDELDLVLTVLSEIVCNGIIYSKSPSVALVQSYSNTTYISISDYGIGFKKSLELKTHKDYSIISNLKEEGRYDEKNEGLYYILEIMEYSRKMKRINLWVLKNLMIKYGGKMIITFEGFQVIFTKETCLNCKNFNTSLLNCVNCMIENNKIVKRYSKKLRGVNIDLEIYHKKKNKEVVL